MVKCGHQRQSNVPQPHKKGPMVGAPYSKFKLWEGGHICGIVHYKECKTVEIVCDIACGLIIGVHVAVYVVICSLKYANQSHHIILKDS